MGAKSILEVMLENRKQMSQSVKLGVKQTPPSFGLPQDLLFQVAEVQDFSNDKFSLISLFEPTKPFSKSYCKGQRRSYISDLRLHYQCNIPGIYRGCYRNLIGEWYNTKILDIRTSLQTGALDWTQGLSKINKLAMEDFEYVRDYCLTTTDTSKLPKEVIDVFSPIISTSSTKPAHVAMRTAFTAFYPKQIVSLPGGKEINIFDYIMSSGPFDFDYEQQQAVLNAYYGDLKPNGDFDPTDKADCESVREPRLIDDKESNYCMPDTPKKYGIYSIGR